MCLDLALRREGKTTLDDVMRAIWMRCAAGPMQEADLRAVLLDLAGRPWDSELDQWVHSTEELPLLELLASHGVTLRAETPQLAQRLGLRVTENHSVQVKSVLRGGAAEKAGLASGDEWLGLAVKGQEWRVCKLDDVAFYAGTETSLTAVVARDGRLLHLPLELAAASNNAAAHTAASKTRIRLPLPQPDTISLSATDTSALARWLA
jgi:predicted metalloprotease with PDZ domain